MRTVFMTLLSVVTVTLAQEWTVQCPLPTGRAMGCVAFADAVNGWAGGEYGTIIHTTDGGATWSVQHEGESGEMYIVSLCFPDAQTGWALCEYDLLFHTENGGQTWVPWPVGYAVWGSDITFTSPSNGWIFGDMALHTTDGGTLWDSVFVGIHGYYGWMTGFFLDDSYGWVAAADTVTRTTDGGQTWSVFPVNRPIVPVNLCFVSPENGWMTAFDRDEGLSYGYLFHTSDGGETWTMQQTDPNGWFSNILFTDEQHGWFQTVTAIFRTSDGGESWDSYESPMRGIWALGHNGSGGLWATGSFGLILHSEDGGITWEDQNSGLDIPYNAVAFADHEVGWAGGQQEYNSYDPILLRTTNGGAHWRISRLPREIGPVTDLSYVGRDLVWALVSRPDYANILHSSDGGITWEMQLPPDSIHPLCAIQFVDALTGWAVGNEGIFHTTNGGQEWTLTESPENCTHVFFMDPENGWVARSIMGWSVLRHTTDGGQTWEEQTAPNAISVNDLTFTSSTHGWLIGNASMYRTTDAGQTWEEMDLPASCMPPRHIVFADGQNGWLSGDESGSWWLPRLWNTSDGGDTWQPVVDPELEGFFLRDFAFADADKGWFVGRGKILRYEGPASVEFGHSQIVKSYALAAHPNPFNPRTTITVELPQSGRMTLAVYDVTGRLVQTLANRVFPGGSHEFVFDASALPTGVYFAHGSAAGQSQTVKLLLLK